MASQLPLHSVLINHHCGRGTLPKTAPSFHVGLAAQIGMSHPANAPNIERFPFIKVVVEKYGPDSEIKDVDIHPLVADADADGPLDIKMRTHLDCIRCSWIIGTSFLYRESGIENFGRHVVQQRLDIN